MHQITGAFLPRMVEQGAGAVLNVASTAAFQPLPGFATYAASKAFVHSFSEAVHSELSGTGVSVTSLCPGFTRTEFEQAAGAEDAASKLPGFTWMESDDVARQAIERHARREAHGRAGRAQQGGVDERALHPADGAAPARRPVSKTR